VNTKPKPTATRRVLFDKAMERAIYKYTIFTWDAQNNRRVLVTNKMRVEVLEEKGNRLKIKYLEHHARTQDIHTLHWVFAKSVQRSEAPEVKPVREGVRLPYKDND